MNNCTRRDIAKKGDPFENEAKEYTDIQEYKKQIAESDIEVLEPEKEDLPLGSLLNNDMFKLQKKSYDLALYNTSLTSTISDDQNKIKELLKRIDANTSPPKKLKHKPQIERDPISNTILKAILTDPKPKGAHRLAWYRFQLVSLIMFYTGLRVGETVNMTKEDFDNLIIEGKCHIYQPKSFI